MGLQGFGQASAPNPYAMGAPILAGDVNEEYAAGYSNGVDYSTDPAQIRRDKARGRHMPY